MIQIIGLMVGAYIFTKMTELLFGASSVISKVFAVITLLIAVLGILGLIITGNEMPRFPR